MNSADFLINDILIEDDGEPHGTSPIKWPHHLALRDLHILLPYLNFSKILWLAMQKLYLALL